MKRDINATVSITQETVNLTVLERLTTATVELFNESNSVANLADFMASAITRIAKIIGARLRHVSVVVEPSEDLCWRIILHRETVRIDTGAVTTRDVNAALDQTRHKFANVDTQVALVQPMKFEVHDMTMKSYSKAPIGRHGHLLAVTSSVVTMNARAYDRIIQMMHAHDLTVSQILLMPQALAHNHLSDNALVSGAVLIHVTDHQTFVSINKNSATVANMCIYDYGFHHLATAIVKACGCNLMEAHNLIAAHATLEDDDNQTCATIVGEAFTTSDLRRIVGLFMGRMMAEVRRFLIARGIHAWPVVVSGKIWRIESVDRFIRSTLDEAHVSVYNPLTFIEMNEQNASALGMMKFMRTFDEACGQRFDTIVETNPNTLSSISFTGVKTTWFERLRQKMTGNHDWN